MLWDSPSTAAEAIRVILHMQKGSMAMSRPKNPARERMTEITVSFELTQLNFFG